MAFLVESRLVDRLCAHAVRPDLGRADPLQAQRARRESNLRREQAALALAREANEERLRFYTNITHELRTPLTLIIGPVDDLMNDKELP